MFILKKKFRFEASHQLVFHDGKCARLHGHSWVMIVAVKGFDLQGASKDESINPKLLMLMDYSDLKAIVQPIVDKRLDHYHLNDTFATNAPTSEYLAQMLFYQVRRALNQWQDDQGANGDHKISLEYVEIKETCTSGCRYSD